MPDPDPLTGLSAPVQRILRQAGIILGPTITLGRLLTSLAHAGVAREECAEVMAELDQQGRLE